MAKKAQTAAPEAIEKQLWKAADKLRKNIDAAEYKHVVMGLIFLRFISDSFEALHAKLSTDKWADPEDKDEYLVENVLFVPKKARWSVIQKQAKVPTIGVTLDEAMEKSKRIIHH